MNILKIKATIKCDLCGCQIKKNKSIKVDATEKEASKVEANKKVQIWQKSLEGKKCRICQSILL